MQVQHPFPTDERAVVESPPHGDPSEGCGLATRLMLPSKTELRDAVDF